MRTLPLLLALSLWTTPLFCAGKRPDGGTAPPAPASAPAGAVITGTAAIELRNNTLQALSGLEIALCPESAVPRLKDIRNERWLATASRADFGDGYKYLDLRAIGAAAAEAAAARVKAGEDGTFRFTGVPPGDYRLYAQYKSNYAAGYWLVAVAVKRMDETLTVHLNNGNMAEIFNRKQR